MEQLILHLPVILWTGWVFAVGAVVGSLLNVCIARLPAEKSIIWPMASHCSNCLRRIAWYDNIPLLSYWMLRGRCRHCRSAFSIRYFFVELLTATLITLSFWLEVIQNIHGMAYFKEIRWQITQGAIPMAVWIFMAHRILLVSLLVIAAMCDFESREIPLGVTLFGTLTGLAFSVITPWPWPNRGADVAPLLAPGMEWWKLDPAQGPPTGLYPWPAFELSAAWPPGSWTVGLATGVIGALVGTFMLRAIRFIFTRAMGREALGLGDADLMMMVGAFLGWQPVVVAFFMGALVTLVFAVIQLIVKQDNALAFGPGLAVASVLTVVFWERIGPAIQPIAFHSTLLGMLTAGGALFMVLAGAVLRLRSGGTAIHENENPSGHHGSN